MINRKIVFSPEVKKKAIENSSPILALESTIISHGMPYPENIKLAEELEEIIRGYGVTPATICLMDGNIKIGLCKTELHKLATAKQVKKVSRRDIGPVLIKGETGATTVAATMVLADLAGIKVFATGGIGGVHKGAEESFDISADLLELSRTPVIVVSAGAKAILDLNKTLEYLETMSVPVLGYRTNIFPAFYSSNSKLMVNRFDHPSEVSDILKLNLELGLNQGILVANPIPEQFEIPFDEMANIINRAIIELNVKKIIGQGVTPFLLKKIVELSEGRALKANIELVKNNARLGAEIAKLI